VIQIVKDNRSQLELGEESITQNFRKASVLASGLRDDIFIGRKQETKNDTQIGRNGCNCKEVKAYV
jgi:hypothetical protein